MTITGKLIIVLLIAVIFILIISIYLAESFRITSEKTIAQNSAEIANEVLKRLNYNLRIFIEDLFLYSTNDYLGPFFSGVKIKSNENKIADSLYISDKLKEQFFKYWGANRGYQLFKNVHIVELNGNIISSTDESLINTKTDIYKLSNELEKTDHNISEIFYDKKSNDYIISITVLLKKENGDNTGIIQADLSVLSFLKEVEIDFELYDLSQLIIVSLEHKKLIFKSGSFNMLEDVSKENYFNNLRADKDYFITEESNQKYIYSYAGKSGQYKWIPDWAVIIKNSEKEILSPLNSLLIQIYFIISLLIIILSAAIILIIRSILSSVKNLQQGASMVGSGNFDYQIKSIAKDELNEVVLSFNKMTNNLNSALIKKDELEKKVEERTHELMSSNKELEAFSYSVSHDLRAPLRAIDGFSKVLLEHKEDRLDEESQRYLNIIRSNTQTMGKLIDDLLSFSRVGKQEMRASPIDMEHLAREVMDEIAPQNPGRIIELNIESPPESFGDATLIKIVLMNLLTNAVKFTRTKPEAAIELGGSVSDNETVYYVKDNGVGFDMKYRGKLFGVFQRLHSQDEFEGTGVGLALVQRIIHRHGGRVWAEGKIDEGAVFYFALPIQAGSQL